MTVFNLTTSCDSLRLVVDHHATPTDDNNPKWVARALFSGLQVANLPLFLSTLPNKEGTTKNKHRLEVLAKNEGFSAKAHHSHNGTLVSDAHKSDCDAQNQKYILSVSGVTSSKYRVPERNTSRPLCRGLVQIYYTRLFNWAGKASVRYRQFVIEIIRLYLSSPM